MVHKHAYLNTLNTLLLLHSAFKTQHVEEIKMPLNGWRPWLALDSHGNYIVDHGKVMEKSWNCIFEFLWEP